MTKRVLLSILAILASISPAAAQTGIRFPNSLVISAAALQAGAQAQAPAPGVPAPPTSSGPRMPLTVDEALKLALDHNMDISVQRINQQTYDISMATLRAVYSPTLTSTLTNAGTKTTSTSTTAGAATGVTINSGTFTFNGGLSQQIRWHGGNIQATFNNNRQTTTSLNATFNPQYQSNWSATYTQPLLRNFSIDSNHVSLLVTKINQDVTDLQLQQTITNTLANVRNAYWDYVFAVQSVAIARQSLSLAQDLLQNNQTKVEIGTLAPIDVVTAQSQVAQQRQALVTAQGTARTAEIALKRLIVSGTTDPVWMSTIDPVDRADFTPTPIDVNAAIQRAQSGRTDVLVAKKNLESNAITMKLLQNQLLPQADVSARYQTSGTGGTQFITTGNGVNREVIGTVPGGYLDALSTLFRQKLPNWNVSVNLSYPLGTSTAETSMARAKVQQNQIDVQLRQIDLAVAIDVSNAAVAVQNATERVQAAQAARLLAQQQFDAESSKFTVGMSTNYQIVQMQRDLANAQNNELSAILAYRRAMVEFERVQQTGNGGNVTVISR